MAVTATLAGKKITSAKATIPAWGAWYAEASVDGEVSLSGQVDLVIADLTLKGTILSGGPATGRSTFRIVGGKGGWGKTISKKGYANDAGVKLLTILGDAASEAGESLDVSTVDAAQRVGPAFTRRSGLASRVLERYASQAWYVAEDGTTKLGARTPQPLSGKVTRTTPINRAHARIELASETIATILPGVVVDGLTAVDVVHEISAKGGLRSTVYGALGGTTTSRRLKALRDIVDQLDPDRQFRAVWEYRVVTLEGNRASLQPVLVSTGMPDLRRVPIRPGIPGAYGAATLGSRVLVGFVNADPGRPYVAGFEDVDSQGFTPTTLDFMAGGQVGGEHVATVEATALMIYNVLSSLGLALIAAGAAPTATGALLGGVLQPLLTPAILTALTAQIAPAPPGTVAQNAANSALQSVMTAGTAPTNTLFDGWLIELAAASSKTPNVSGLFPSLGSAAVRAG